MQDNNSYNVMILATIISLLLHLGMLALADYLQQHKTSSITITKVDADTRDDSADENKPEDEDEPRITPGIDNGRQATVTWIGYTEYEKHLAQLAEVEQAAFTTNSPAAASQPKKVVSEYIPPAQVIDAPVLNETDISLLLPEETRSAPASSTDVIEQSVIPGFDETVDLSDKLPDKFEYEADEADSEHVVPPVNDNDSDIEETITKDPPPAQSEVETDSEIITDNTEIVNEASDDTAREPVSESKTVEEQPEVAENDVSEVPESVVEEIKQTPVPAAEASNKDSEAASTKKIPEIDWQNGKPVAVEGVEILPYSLYRHIIIDSRDRMFAVRWEGKIKRNPVVSLQFDRTGKVRKVTLLRNTGYKTFDKMYLVTWLSRWTARGKSLLELEKNELCKPIIFKLLFIDEPEQDKKKKKSGAVESDK